MNFSSGATEYDITGDPEGWVLEFEYEFPEPGLELATWRLRSDSPRTPPRLKLSFSASLTDCQVKWHQKNHLAESHHFLPWWGRNGRLYTSLVRNAPVCSFLNLEGVNRMTFALSEATRDVFFSTGQHEARGGLFITEIELYATPGDPCLRADFTLRIDRRPLFYADALRQVADWYAAMPEYRPAPVPPEVRLPFYSTWYQFQKDVSASRLERELEFIREGGFRTVIVDYGWECDEVTGGGSTFSSCGRWEPSAGKFPDMAGHVRKFHDRGIGYMLWFSVPFVGCGAPEVFEQFEGKYLNPDAEDFRILDPRYPEVREFLIQTYERAVREWDIDGLKLDFVDLITTVDLFSSALLGDPAASTGYRGCSHRSVAEATGRLLADATERLKRLKPDLMIEFRQRYCGPATRRYATMFRASDCAYDMLENRVRTIDLRLLAGDTAVHSDMMIWSAGESAEVAALQILNVLFSVPQVSVLLEKLPERHRVMLNFWMRFMTEHREALQSGRLEPLHPELSYPLVTAYGKSEAITAVYERRMTAAVASRHLVVNATRGDAVNLELKTPGAVRCFDATGTPAGQFRFDRSGSVRCPVPPSGYLEFTPG